jgi:hypothetical protein
MLSRISSSLAIRVPHNDILLENQKKQGTSLFQKAIFKKSVLHMGKFGS